MAAIEGGGSSPCMPAQPAVVALHVLTPHGIADVTGHVVCLCCPAMCSCWVQQRHATSSWRVGGPQQRHCSRRSANSGGLAVAPALALWLKHRHGGGPSRALFDKAEASVFQRRLFWGLGRPAAGPISTKARLTARAEQMPLQPFWHAGSSLRTSRQLAWQLSSRLQPRQRQQRWLTAKLQRPRRLHHVSEA